MQTDGRTHTVEWPRNQVFVDVMLAAGIEAPYACREGECGACECSVTDGRVVMERVGILDSDDIAAGLALACQARPATDDVTVTFD